MLHEGGESVGTIEIWIVAVLSFLGFHTGCCLSAAATSLTSNTDLAQSGFIGAAHMAL